MDNCQGTFLKSPPFRLRMARLPLCLPGFNRFGADSRNAPFYCMRQNTHCSGPPSEYAPAPSVFAGVNRVDIASLSTTLRTDAPAISTYNTSRPHIQQDFRCVGLGLGSPTGDRRQDQSPHGLSPTPVRGRLPEKGLFGWVLHDRDDLGQRWDGTMLPGRLHRFRSGDRAGYIRSVRFGRPARRDTDHCPAI